MHQEIELLRRQNSELDAEVHRLSVQLEQVRSNQVWKDSISYLRADHAKA